MKTLKVPTPHGVAEVTLTDHGERLHAAGELEVRYPTDEKPLVLDITRTDSPTLAVYEAPPWAWEASRG